MIPFSLNAEKHFLPSGWDEVSVNKFFELLETDVNDPFAIVSVLSGIEYDRAITIDAKSLVTDLMPSLAWINDKLKLEEIAKPSHIKIGTKFIPVSFQLAEEPFGLKILAQSAMNDDKPEFELITYTLAVYLYFKYYGCDYNEMNAGDFDEKLSVFQKLIGHCSITEAYPVATFFLTKLKPSTKQNPKCLKLSSQMTSWQQGLKVLKGSE